MIGIFDILSLFFGGPTSKEMEQAEIDIENARASGDKRKTIKTAFGILATVVCIVVTISIFLG
ncbi:hypothetical protein [Eggerthella guodeyinii]|uniref:Uncharacterized protein n=1 Tax=Eggerthella guodeyinii TaxID=2690837 RepID=A0A6N7RN25_9ACTN|nr:hypothetical protein [Eggerthella guodeyinii]MRX82733.1 hypothetical protein [Eggerthella guodeyinii]